MGECCALLICRLHLVLKAQQFPWPLCLEVAVEDDFLEKVWGGNSSYKTTSQAPLSYFKMQNSSQKYHWTACVPGTIAVTETNMN